MEGKHPSVMAHSFSNVPKAEIQRSVFDRTHCYKTTFNVRYLVPFFVDEIVPGDSFNVKATIFARLATPIVPFMDNLYCDIFWFFVPYRLVWDNFKKMMGEQVNPNDSTVYLVPRIQAPAVTGWAVGSLSDYFGLPTGIASIYATSLAHRSYNLIYNEWFRDQNLNNSVVVDKDDGPDTDSDYILLTRNKRFDYFTSCLPWPQKGASVTIPLGDSAPVIGVGMYNNTWVVGPQAAYESNGAIRNYANFKGFGNPESADNQAYVEENALTGYPNIRADLANATQSTTGTINSLRQAFQLQKLLERDARGGTRYIELVRAHFGVINPDFRIQRPEYLGGGTVPIMVTPVAQTSQTGATGTPQGNLAAFGTMAHNRNGFSKSFTEHGLVMGILNVRSDLTYQQGMPRFFSKRSKYDFYWPALANIGEQTVLNKEIYCDGTSNDDVAFGYQERFAEYRYKPSMITGKLRSTAAGTLDVWHLAQHFTSLPALNYDFISENPPIDRVIAVDNEPHFVMDSYIQCKCVRPMPVYSVPGLVDHF